MTEELHITAILPAPVKSCKQSFLVGYPKQGGGSVELTPHGDYIIVADNMTESEAMSTSECKAAFGKVSCDMLHAYSDADAAYTALHRNMAAVPSPEECKQKLQGMAPQKYRRAAFALAKPEKGDVEGDLRAEARAVNFVTKGGLSRIDEDAFVNEHLNAMTESRMLAWQEARSLFDRIEKAREARGNRQYDALYKAQCRQEEEFISGTVGRVEQGMEVLCAVVKVPYDIALDYRYEQDLHLMEASVVLEEGIAVPTLKASMLPSGRISVRDKLVTEIASDKARGAVSLAYFLAGGIFAVTPNILKLRIALYCRSKQAPLLWVEFGRERFSRIIPSSVNVLTDILGYPKVINLRSDSGSAELCRIDRRAFEDAVRRMCGSMASIF